MERVACRDEPGQSYALYLPSSYSAERRWPVLYVLDPRGRGERAAELFRQGAEEHGYVLASSHNSRSDEAEDPNAAALQALWSDTHARLSIDDRRVYLAGFSGTARAATLYADLVPGAAAGVIAVGAGFAEGRRPHAGLPFALYAVAGEADFNYQEVQELAASLEALGLPHRVETFDGGHEWPPSAECGRAVGWMELRGMRDGRRPRDEARLDRLLSADLARAGELEASGRPFEAWRLLAAVVRDYDGLRSVEEVRSRAQRLAASKPHEADRKRRASLARKEQAHLEQARQALARVYGAEDLPSLGELLWALRIRDLRSRAEGGAGRDDRLSARRLLAELFVQSAWYLPRELMDRREHRRAALLLSLATEIQPEASQVWLRLARARARLGERGGALEALERAVETGFHDAGILRTDPDLEPLRDQEAFRRILERVGSGPAS